MALAWASRRVHIMMNCDSGPYVPNGTVVGAMAARQQLHAVPLHPPYQLAMERNGRRGSCPRPTPLRASYPHSTARPIP